jgi:hypothetical protein
VGYFECDQNARDLLRCHSKTFLRGAMVGVYFQEGFYTMWTVMTLRKTGMIRMTISRKRMTMTRYDEEEKDSNDDVEAGHGGCGYSVSKLTVARGCESTDTKMCQIRTTTKRPHKPLERFLGIKKVNEAATRIATQSFQSYGRVVVVAQPHSKNHKKND